MKKMKKLITVLLTVLMLVSLCACGAKDDKVVRIGELEGSGMNNMRTEEHSAHREKFHNTPSDATVEFVNYNNLSAALMDLEACKIVSIGLEECTAKYIAAHNEKFEVHFDEDKTMTNFSMMTLDSNKEVYDVLNNAIVEMKADGTLDALIANELKAYIESDPEAKDLPHFDGAKTIRVGVTGDLPPMDFVASNGKAAGFNIALLTEIANRAQVNIELVQIETGARPIALSSNKVDAVFWTKSINCTICGAEGVEEIEGTIVTESYFSDYIAGIAPKSAK